MFRTWVTSFLSAIPGRGRIEWHVASTVPVGTMRKRWDDKGDRMPGAGQMDHLLVSMVWISPSRRCTSRSIGAKQDALTAAPKDMITKHEGRKLGRIERRATPCAPPIEAPDHECLCDWGARRLFRVADSDRRAATPAVQQDARAQIHWLTATHRDRVGAAEQQSRGREAESSIARQMRRRSPRLTPIPRPPIEESPRAGFPVNSYRSP